MPRQTVKAVIHAPLKLIEPLLVGALVVVLIGFSLAAGSSTALPHAVPGFDKLYAALTTQAVPATRQIASIDR